MWKQFPGFVPFLIIASLVISSCEGNDQITLKIVSSLPLTGSSKPQTTAIANAMQLRVEQAKNKACDGKYRIVYESWDDSSAVEGGWTAEMEIQNANNAVNDKSIVAYLGTFNSGAAKLSIPILNQAGMVMISPANTYPGLTHKVEGVTEPDEPDVYFQNDLRNYVRLAATDDLQGPVITNFMVAQGIKSVYVLDDGDVYGRGVAEAVILASQKAGIAVAGNETYDTKAASYLELMRKISTSNNDGAPDAIFVGAVVENNAGQLLKDKVVVLGDNQRVKFIGPDGLYTAGIIETAGTAVAEGAFATTPGLALANLGETGQKFYADYAKRFGETNEPYAIMGYEAMNVALKAIEDVCAAGGDPTNRKAIRDAVIGIKGFEGALGTWSFNENGDITIPYFLVGQVQNGKFVQFGTYTP
jgi:branched-chain amino acid transport system substrate-binding protein